ncbi:MAG TPA: OmpA family protein, partial [Polyangiales bacterium]|nr:OmpA family protein [Polyangiales bacterium]
RDDALIVLSVGALQVLATAMIENSALRVIIEVHLDAKATQGDLDEHSQARSLAIGRWLIDHGVNARQLEAYGCGANRPRTSNKREHAQNERVDVLLVHPLPAFGMPSSFGCTATPLPLTAAPNASAPSAADGGRTSLDRSRSLAPNVRQRTAAEHSLRAHLPQYSRQKSRNERFCGGSSLDRTPSSGVPWSQVRVGCEGTSE